MHGSPAVSDAWPTVVPVTTNRRYSEHYDQMRAEHAAQSPARPCTLPASAYGPTKIEWIRPHPPVWAWITWPDRPAERIAAFATGWNDRVVIVKWYGPRGEQDTVVWRNAVTRRAE